MSDHNVPPLDTSPELRNALRALAEEGPTSAQLEAVAGKLGALLDAAPPVPAATSGWLRTLASKATVTRFALALLAAGSTLAFLQSRSEPNKPAGLALESAQVSSAQVLSPQPTQTNAAPAAPSMVASAVEQAQDESFAPPEQRKLTRRATTFRQRGAMQPTHSALPVTPVQPPAPVGDVVRSRAEPQPVLDSDSALAEPEPKPANQPDRQPLPPAKTEVELLVEARRLLTTQPAAALRTLDQHAARFRDGLLAPEREVLAIEALRKLGRTAGAEQRLRAFRARYPDSMHLPRLASPGR